MDSNLIARVHLISVMLFLLTYVIKTILLFTNKPLLGRYSKATKVPEMIISTLFLVTGVWLFVLLGGIKKIQIIKLIMVFLSIPVAIVAFKKMKKGLALLALVLIIGAYGMGEAGKSKPFIPKHVDMAEGTGTPILMGEKVYLENCTFCHGKDGKKGYRNAPDLTKSVLDEGGVSQMIREGSSGKMPAYVLIISDEKIAAISTYVESMKSTASIPN